MEMQIATIDYRGSITDGPGIRTVLYVQGCKQRCCGCHNPHTWDMVGGQSAPVRKLASDIRSKTPSKKLTISGGEPLLQVPAVLELIQELVDFDIALYTGYELEEVPSELLDILNHIKVGKYDESKRDTTQGYYGSTNQRFFSFKKPARMVKTKPIQYDNASQRLKPSAHIYNIGVKAAKDRILQSIDNKHAGLHKEGSIHIHDLDTYKYTYNCLQLDVLKGFPYGRFAKFGPVRKIIEVFAHFQNLIVKLGHEQSGGIGFPNLDDEISRIFANLSIPDNDANLSVLKDCMESFIDWLNESHERITQYTFYVTINLGLCTAKVGRFVTRSAIQYFKDSSLDVIKPNIVFKVKKGVNYLPEDPNYDLFCLAVESTCRKMIPTYILFDSSANKAYVPYNVAIMGCRTRVVTDLFGEPRSIGRGNIAYVSINLPRIALEIDRGHPDMSVDDKFALFQTRWAEMAVMVKEILINRYRVLCDLKTDDFPCNSKSNLWVADFKGAATLEDVFKHGTLSIGFIGLSETVEILSGKKYYSSEGNYARALAIVQHMRDVVDRYKEEHRLNFTLLASSGEFISGRFPEEDRKIYAHSVLEKGYYTNSFHVDVDSRLDPFEKIRYEGPFHALCNGGCISYVEFASAPLINTEAVTDVIAKGIGSGVNYLGINYPLDSCRGCGASGTFDLCPKCGGKEILRIRRISGYLDDLEYFTAGKKAEEAQRAPNEIIFETKGDE